MNRTYVVMYGEYEEDGIVAVCATLKLAMAHVDHYRKVYGLVHGTHPRWWNDGSIAHVSVEKIEVEGT